MFLYALAGAFLVSTIISAKINQFDQPGLVGWLPVSVSLLHLEDISLTRLHMIVENYGLDHYVYQGQDHDIHHGRGIDQVMNDLRIFTR